MEQNSGKGYRKIALISTLAVVLAVAVAGIGMLLATGIKESRYSSALSKANAYYTAGDYNNAIAWYDEAIAIDDTREAAYLNKASAYVAMGDYTSAKATIDSALVKISSQALLDRQGEYNNLLSQASYATGSDEVEEVTLTAEDIETYSADIGAENSVFDMIASYTYTDYYRDYGAASSADTSNSRATLYYADMDMTLVFYNIGNELVLDTSSGMPLATVRACEVSFGDLTRLFSGSADSFAVSRAKLSELFSDASFYQGSDGNWYMSATYKKCQFTVQTDESGNIVSRLASNTISPLYRSSDEDPEAESEGEVSGYVQDATTGKGMKATIKIRERGKKVGDAIEEISVGFDGSYTFGGDAGRYTAEVSASGYITEYVDLEIVKGQNKAGENIVLSPEVGEGEIRIVLTWNSSPADLDSYAIGTSSTGSSFNINYRNKTMDGIGNLDVDDTNGYGPETITITDIGSSFTFKVMDYRVTGYLPGCGATVKVYLPGESSAQTFTVPTGEGVLWEVFKYENGTITSINTLKTLDQISTSEGIK